MSLSSKKRAMPLLVAGRTQGYLMATMRAAPVVVTEGLAMALQADVKMGQTYPHDTQFRSESSRARYRSVASERKETKKAKEKVETESGGERCCCGCK